jgi:hypothetical protein
MKKIIPAMLTLMLIWGFALTLMTGCQTPTQKKEKAEARKEIKAEQLETNRLAQAKVGVGMNDAALHALRKNPVPTPYDDVARMTLETGLLAFTAADLMPPSFEILRYRKMVDDLLSSNEVLRASASNTMTKVQGQIAAGERKEQSLLADLAKLQGKLDAVNKENAALASTWVAIKRFFYWIVWIVGGVFVLRIVASVVPPPYNSVGFILDYVVGGFVRMVFGVLSHAKEAAGVVAIDAHNLMKTTLEQVVAALEQAKKENPGLKDALKPYLKNETDKYTTRPVIEQIKSSL